jgi:membrane peptidoglycan carboxypeptidase
MGQEIAVTMIQLARAFSVIANGGFLVEPHYVDKVVSREGEVIRRFEPASHERILSPSTCETMKELCAGVVTDGTGEKAQILEYRVGGKTGTAQIARPGGGGYIPNAFTTVFTGFAPVRDPRLVSVIVVQEPNIKLHYGGYVCGPVFQKVVRDALIDMEVPQDPVLDEDGVPLIEKLKLKGKEFIPEMDESRFIEDTDGTEAPQPAQRSRAISRSSSALRRRRLSRPLRSRRSPARKNWPSSRSSPSKWARGNGPTCAA